MMTTGITTTIDESDRDDEEIQNETLPKHQESATDCLMMMIHEVYSRDRRYRRREGHEALEF